MLNTPKTIAYITFILPNPKNIVKFTILQNIPTITVYLNNALF